MRLPTTPIRPILLAASLLASAAVQAQPASTVKGPFVGAPVLPHVWNGDLRSLPQSDTEEKPFKTPGTFRLTPLERRAREAKALELPPVGVSAPPVVSAPMPSPVANFAGMSRTANGSGWPPDTNGDVGPNHYVQTVNSSIGIYDKATGTALSTVTLNTFFQGPAGTPCDTSNDGDPVVVYDPTVDRWIVTDFAWFNASTGPFYECIAVSQTGDPVAGGWYFYALQADTGTFAAYLNDYPKLGVWPDGYYMSANMFQAVGDGFGVRLWAINRTPLLTGGALQEVHFDLCTDGSCGSFLPSNLRGTTPPPAGAPNYFMAAGGATTVDLYRFHVDWTTPANSTLTGPIQVPVSPYAFAASGVPQQGSVMALDTLSFRLMMQLQYRNHGTHQSVYAVHSVDDGGIVSSRWYELRDPSGTPTLHQQGTHKLSDGNHRWMGSIASDRDGNVALGYSVSGPSLYPSIRYAGRRVGETLGTLPQTETSLVAGTGSQTTYDRWGDYSTLSVDPTDDCTFWYTQEYYATTGTNWQTRIGSFKFPACNQPKGTLSGRVYDAATNANVPNAPVTLTSPAETLTLQADASGNYSAVVLPGTYGVAAGPVPPGYPTPNAVPGQAVVASAVTTVDVPLTPAPNLVYASTLVVDPQPLANGNGYPEPGESGVQLTVSLTNNGAAASTGVSAVLSTSTTGVTVTQNGSAYPNVAPGASGDNATAYVIALANTVPCGTILQFRLAVTTAQGPYTPDFSIRASIPQPPAVVFSDSFESGVNGWTTGGTANSWAQTTSQSQSPTHSWTESPAGTYPNGMNSWLASPVVNLAARTGVTVSAYVRHDLEPGYDYAYLEYSLDGGTSWNPTYLARWNATQSTFTLSTVAAPALDNQANVKLRYRVQSDGGVVADGFYVDDFAVRYTPIVCSPAPAELQSFSAD